MSTGNFVTMKDFPLYAKDDEEFIIRDKKGNYLGLDNWEIEDFICYLSEELDNINSDLMFYEISLKHGYYSGIQFYVNEKYEYEDIKKWWDNSDCKSEFDLCKSNTLRKYDREFNKVNKILKRLAKKYRFENYYVSARFSNGETWYSKVI